MKPNGGSADASVTFPGRFQDSANGTLAQCPGRSGPERATGLPEGDMGGGVRVHSALQLAPPHVALNPDTSPGWGCPAAWAEGRWALSIYDQTRGGDRGSDSDKACRCHLVTVQKWNPDLPQTSVLPTNPF